MSYIYSTKEIVALADVVDEKSVYINEEGYQIKFNGEYFSEHYNGKCYGVAILKIKDRWMKVEKE